MKKIFVVAAILLAALTAKAEIVERDTVQYDGEWRMEKVSKTNDFGEVRNTYYAYIKNQDATKEKKVRVDKKTYEGDCISHLVFAVYDDGSERIVKAICKK